MLFNSLAFVLFLPLVVLCYFMLPVKWRNIFLLGASCYFYMYFRPLYILILCYTIAVDYIAGIQIEKHAGNRRKQRRWLYASLVANLGALAFFKYGTFLMENVFSVMNLFRADTGFSAWDILLPIGLSFHTFQAISYTVEVYRGNQKAERNIIDYALYVMFFPQLVAGPIERPQRLIHQFKEKHYLTYENFSLGAQWILWGMFKKIVVADNLAMIVDKVYDNPQAHTGTALIVATVLFAFQIYGDFSGYSDIARGSARILGFELSINFNLPYFSESVSEFWRRWHVSLSGWFKDYVYIPLGGNRERPLRNTVVTFALSGIWHGANFTYMIWGLMNGILVYLHKLLFPTRSRLPSVLRMLVTFVLIDFCWIYFRSNSLTDAWYVTTHLFSGLNMSAINAMGVERHTWGVSLAMLALMLLVEWLTRIKTLPVWWNTTGRVPRVIFLNLILTLILFFGVFEHRTFIYFQF
jgi:alginate O-acetyltransferase complex protein AlgI